MPDICKCKGDGCPIRDNCFRFTSLPSIRQSYFVEIPWDGEKCIDFYENYNLIKKDKMVK